METSLSLAVGPGRMQNMLQQRVIFDGVPMARECALELAKPFGWLAMADVFGLPGTDEDPCLCDACTISSLRS